jgi:hypothetical protein
VIAACKETKRETDFLSAELELDGLTVFGTQNLHALPHICALQGLFETRHLHRFAVHQNLAGKGPLIDEERQIAAARASERALDAYHVRRFQQIHELAGFREVGVC